MPTSALPVALAVPTVAVPDNAGRRDDVAFALIPDDESVFALGASSDDALASESDAAVGSDASGVDSVALALAETADVERAFGELS